MDDRSGKRCVRSACGRNSLSTSSSVCPPRAIAAPSQGGPRTTTGARGRTALAPVGRLTGYTEPVPCRLVTLTVLSSRSFAFWIALLLATHSGIVV